MIIERKTGPVEADALVVFAAEDATPRGIAESLAQELKTSGEFTGKSGETVLLHRPEGAQSKRVLLAGLGKAGKAPAAELRRAAGAALRALKGKGVRTAAFAIEGGDELVTAAVEGVLLADWEPDQHKTDPKKNEKRVERVVIQAPDSAQTAFERGRVLGESQNLTRDLANEPGNLLTPMKLAAAAQAMAAEAGLQCEVLDTEKMRSLGMGSLLGVAMGSAEPPALIVIRYQPEKAGAGKSHLGLVGKGVTFDTGGISIKPADGMEKMKYDMSGGAAVIGAMRAIARLKPGAPVTALIPTVENMPGSKAQRPGDIVTSMSGKTIEVLNTDAEGRLILADALTYAQKLGCTHLVDAATLTGAIVVALGSVHSGAFTNNDEFLQQVLAAAKSEGENLWPMPLDEEYREQLKSVFADIHNIGGRWGGAITAAIFLKEFVEDRPWVHLDIAGTAWLDDAKPWMSKGPTGVCVRSFVKLAESMAG